ncbi:MAG: hypothetical protein WA990_01170 [Rubrobacteraceae bacterium]
MHSKDSQRGLDRKQFLRLSAAGLAGVALVGGTAGRAVAQPDSSLMREFKDAAKEFGVPVGLLIAMGYVNTRWEMPPPDASEYEEGSTSGWGGYGIMALVKNPSTDTLGEASKLTGIPEEELKTDRRSNIRGGAALLAESQKAQGRPKLKGPEQDRAQDQAGLNTEELDGWTKAVSGKGAFKKLGARVDEPAPAGVGGGEIYAEQVAGTLKSGASGRTKAGERVDLKSQGAAGKVLDRLGEN